MKPRLKLVVCGPDYGFTKAGFGLITDVWLLDITNCTPYMMRVFSRDELGHESGIAKVIRNIMRDVATAHAATIEKAKIKCGERRCGWRGTEDKVLVAKNPFYPGEEIWGCPDCGAINTMLGVCDEPGCWEETSCGTKTPEGYRRTCGKHMPTK